MQSLPPADFGDAGGCLNRCNLRSRTTASRCSRSTDNGCVPRAAAAPAHAIAVTRAHTMSANRVVVINPLVLREAKIETPDLYEPVAPAGREHATLRRMKLQREH
jgi:hypothetical protein